MSEENGDVIASGDEQTTQPEWTADDETEAKFYGWKSPDEWEGELPAGYIDDPRRYLERAENIAPVKALKKRIEENETAFQERLRKIETVSQKALERQEAQLKADFEQKMTDIAQKQRAAVEDADTAAFDRLEKQKSDLMKQAPDAGPKAGGEWDAAMNDWIPKNDWWDKDMVMTMAAQGASIEAMNDGIKDPAKVLEYVDQKMRESFPHRFGEKKQEARRTAAVSEGLNLGGGKKQGFDSLPDDAKSAFKSFVARGVFKDTKEDREEYYNEYSAA